jgi:hypothetical protein
MRGQPITAIPRDYGDSGDPEGRTLREIRKLKPSGLHWFAINKLLFLLERQP